MLCGVVDFTVPSPYHINGYNPDLPQFFKIKCPMSFLIALWSIRKGNMQGIRPILTLRRFSTDRRAKMGRNLTNGPGGQKWLWCPNTPLDITSCSMTSGDGRNGFSSPKLS